MHTRHIVVDPVNPDAKAIEEAALIIERDGLVAFPTETVYGLGARACSSPAVKKIFAAKNRPANTPLLVHVCNADQVLDLVTEISSDAHLLMEKFWPGPLSLILPASPRVPAVVTAGQSSVGLRMPSHPVALALIARTGPLAAPSANLSGRPSPVTAAHVNADLKGRIEGLLDAGPTGSGVESTVLNLCVKPYKILRLGGTAPEQIESVLGRKVDLMDTVYAKAPHYQVTTRIIITHDAQDFIQQANKWSTAGPVGIVYYNTDSKLVHNPTTINYELDLTGQHGSLFTILRDAEMKKLSALLFSPLPLEGHGTQTAIIQRIYEAARNNSSD